MGFVGYIISFLIFVPIIIYYYLVEFWVAFLCGLSAFIAVVVICCAIPRKKEKLIRIAAVIMGICPSVVIIWYLIFPTAYPYVDLWVLGKTEEEIIEVYGEPNYNESWSDYSELAYYTKYIIFDPDYYIITIDEEGRAIAVREGVFTPRGG